jgi:hypothetical protein
MKIKTLEGVMTANIGDWIIQGVNGEIYPCKPDIFEKTYEVADLAQIAEEGREVIAEGIIGIERFKNYEYKVSILSEAEGLLFYDESLRYKFAEYAQKHKGEQIKIILEAKGESDLKEANEKLANIKYLNDYGAVEKVMLLHDADMNDEKCFYLETKEDIDAFVTAICKLAVKVDRDKIDDALQRYFEVDICQPVKFYKEVNRHGYSMITHLSDIADEIIKSIGGK